MSEPVTPDAVLARLNRLHPKLIDLSLERIARLLSALDNPQDRLAPVIHIAGTNGKGSVAAMLAAMLEAAGLGVHVYTSPHLVRFAERIRIAGRLLEDAALTALLEEVEAANAGQPITFFEITTAAAFLAFARAPAESVILETGLGGRLDATNMVARPALCVLTPISLDHQHFLGPTLADIATEKAHILKPGVPAVSADQPIEAAAVIKARAAALGCPLALEGRDWAVAGSTGGGLRFLDDLNSGKEGTVLDLPAPSLAGAHQYANAGLAVAAARRLPFALSPRALRQGLLHVRWPARLQRLDGGPLGGRLPPGWTLLLDGGHNPSAGAALARHMADTRAEGPLYLVCGMLKTKDLEGFLRPFVGQAAMLCAVPIPGEDASRPAGEIAETARTLGLEAISASCLESALDLCAARPGPARVLICGSLYLAGHALALHGAV